MTVNIMKTIDVYHFVEYLVELLADVCNVAWYLCCAEPYPDPKLLLLHQTITMQQIQPMNT